MSQEANAPDHRERKTNQDWVCPKCGAINHGSRKICRRCYPGLDSTPTLFAIVLALITFFVSTVLAVSIAFLTRNIFLLPIILVGISFLIKIIFPLFIGRFPSTKRKLQKLGEIVFFAYAINFLLFLIITFMIGGDAVNGKIEGGNYYLFQNGGKYTQVSAWIYYYSIAHTALLFVNLLLVFNFPMPIRRLHFGRR